MINIIIMGIYELESIPTPVLIKIKGYVRMSMFRTL